MKKWEKVVFIVVIPIVVYFSLLSVETYIKRNYLPINNNKSIDSIIRSDLHTAQYAYAVFSDYLYCYYQQSGQPNESLLVPKGLHTGYRLVLHGGYSYGYPSGTFSINSKSAKDLSGLIMVYKPRNGFYIITIMPNSEDFKFADSVGSEIKTLTFNGAGQSESVLAIEHMPKDYKLYYNGGNYSGTILTYSQIIKSIGWLQ